MNELFGLTRGYDPQAGRDDVSIPVLVNELFGHVLRVVRLPVPIGSQFLFW